MKIKKIRIQNFRSIIDTGDVNIEGQITTILGKNEQGKTNFLRAIESFRNDYSYTEEDLCYLTTHSDDNEKIPIVTIFIEPNVDLKKLLQKYGDTKGQPNIYGITKYYDNHYTFEPDSLKHIVELIKIEDKPEPETLIGKILTADEIEKNIEWLVSLQNVDGGFCLMPGQQSQLLQTYEVVQSLIELGGLSRIHKPKLIKYIINTQSGTGGFGSAPNQPSQISTTYYAISLLKMLNELSRVNKTKHINWIIENKTPDNGYSNQPKQPSNLNSTYQAIASLKQLNAINRVNKTEILTYIKSTQHANGGFSPIKGQPPQMEFTYAGIRIYKMMMAINNVDVDIQINWIKELQTPDGGFGNTPNSPSTIGSTFQAISTIHELNGDLSLKYNSLEKYILSLKSEDGGFSSILNQPVNAESTFFGVHLVKAYGKHTGISDIMHTILNNLPPIIYFSDINLLNDKIDINEYLENSVENSTFTNLFNLSNLNLEYLQSIEDPHNRKRLFRSASTTITGLVNDSWKQEKVNVNLDIDGDEILIYIEDDAGAKADPPSRRSDGFRWFLSFYINFIAGTKGELKNAILLLDNLGWVLHPSGQSDLLTTLEKISLNNQVVIATHSPFLINKDKLEQIRIVERRKNDGTKIFDKYWHSIYDSLAIIRGSIGADIAHSLFGCKNNVVMEGYSDVLYLEAILEYNEKKDPKDKFKESIFLIGAGGADKIPIFLTLLKAEKYKCIGIVDNDTEGNKVVSEIKHSNTEIDVDKDILKLNEIDEQRKGISCAIEDLIDEKLFLDIVNKAYDELFIAKNIHPLNQGDINTDGLLVKKYIKVFEKKNIGAFDKILVAKKFKELILNDQISEKDLKGTITRFNSLIKVLKIKYKKLGVDL
ncbi:MAG: prenyltransferase/squalene oxidase repeat-containing protein [Methanobacteriota archaeon]